MLGSGSPSDRRIFWILLSSVRLTLSVGLSLSRKGAPSRVHEEVPHLPGARLCGCAGWHVIAGSKKSQTSSLMAASKVGVLATSRLKKASSVGVLMTSRLKLSAAEAGTSRGVLIARVGVTSARSPSKLGWRDLSADGVGGAGGGAPPRRTASRRGRSARPSARRLPPGRRDDAA